MDTTTSVKNGITKAKKKIDSGLEMAEEKVESTETALQERVEQARDLVEDIRDRAEMAFHERPYLLPVATGALGLGVGVLIGSKLSRLILFTVAGALLSDTVRGQVAKLAKDFVADLGAEGDEGDDLDEVEPSVT